MKLSILFALLGALALPACLGDQGSDSGPDGGSGEPIATPDIKNPTAKEVKEAACKGLENILNNPICNVDCQKLVEAEYENQGC